MDLRLVILAIVVAGAVAAARGIHRYFSNPPLPRSFDASDVGESGSNPLVVEFTSPYCLECEEALPRIKTAAARHNATVAVVDARDRPDLAAKYAIRTTPTILVVERGGLVRKGWAHNPPETELNKALASTVN
ncbi:MAG TPA: thioredoxin family protein [Actinomycetota bacterium]|nr:thioredoxin family protein [Actinomycetota bacterium]